jgi:protein-S-isoprenylcysteine O-methyltransferase Ste14
MRTPPLLSVFGALALYAAPQIVVVWRGVRARALRHLGLYFDRTILAKYLAIVFVLTLFLLALLFVGAYQQQRFAPTRAVLLTFYPILLLAAYPYICLVNRMQRETGAEHDEYSHFGNLLMGRWNEVDFAEVRHFALSWAIKLFFFPLMLWELWRATATIYAGEIPVQLDLLQIFALSAVIIYFVDVLIAAAGYLFTLRLFGWEIRSCNPYVLGWVFTLLCYYPFVAWFHPLLFDYKSGLIWRDWLADAGPLLYVWGGAILALQVCWVLAITSLGLRFSNLTNRGIVTGGIYALTKHPSYVAKNLFWWLIFIPFVPTDSAAEAAQRCLALLGVNIIYLLRARYEERHLSEDPRYVAYALWMEQNGLFRVFTRVFTPLRYRPPEGFDASETARSPA